MNGHITLDRKILEWEWYTNINTKVLFLHLLLKANLKDVRWQGMIIKRGQLVTSIPALSEALALTPKEVRVALDHLIATGEVGRQTTNKYSVITVVKYDEYQSEGRQTADKGQSNGSLRATNEEREEIKESNLKEKDKKKVVRFAPPSVEEVKAYCDDRNNGIDPESFIDFYSSKGWKVGNQPMKDWQAAIRTWERRHNEKRPENPVNNPKVHFENERTYDFEAIEKKLLAKQRRADSG
jgi:hypothetical protein